MRLKIIATVVLGVTIAALLWRGGSAVSLAPDEATIRVRVLDADSDRSLPSRITIARVSRSSGRLELAEVGAERAPHLAMRRGVVYTLTGTAEMRLRTGTYRFYATRGFEYSVAEAELQIRAGETEDILLRPRREVDTQGYLAADTHLHTLTYSKHGDASVEERVVTIAGEGVELAIATDHNHHTDYRPAATDVGAGRFFTTLVGNEFTTRLGHLNAFPVDNGAEPANHTHQHWNDLLRALRATPGVRAIVLNHPRRGGLENGPLGKIGFDPVAGSIVPPHKFVDVTAIEVVNGKALEDDALVTFRDWFALLNRGYRLSAVAASDSHTVGQLVGQARTYIRSQIDDPRGIQIDEVLDNFVAGRLLVSLGLLVDVRVADEFRVGDLASLGVADEFSTAITVQGPSWVQADTVTLYLNGAAVRTEKIEHASDAVVKYATTWRLPRPPADAHLVVIATGPPVTAPYWALPQKDKYVLGATNPVWLDIDRDGRFTSAHGYAAKLLEKHGGNTDAAMREARERYDGAVATQVESLKQARPN